MKTCSISMRILALVAVIAGTAFAQSPTKNSLLISPGDNLHITVLDMPEMEQYARVTDAGDVPVQGVGNVRVVDMSPAEAASAIVQRLTGILPDGKSVDSAVDASLKG